MAIIAQKRIFSWKEVEKSPDLERLKMVLDVLPDEKFMRLLEAERKGKRDDFPVRAVWNSLLAGIVFQHDCIEKLRRELARNAELREICGFKQLFNKGNEVLKVQTDKKSELNWKGIPSKHVYKRFLKKILEHVHEIDAMFDELVEMLRELLPEFGKRLAIDSKALNSLHKRTDTDADTGVKKYICKKKDGTIYEKIKSWFGYKLHLIVDADYELPVAFEITKASVSDNPTLVPMVKKLKDKHPELVEKAEVLTADRGYDDGDSCRDLYEKWGIKPVIGMRMMWKDSPDEYRPLYQDKCDQIYYDETGVIYCHCGRGTDLKDFAPMTFHGFDKSRNSLKYRCPASATGLTCHRMDECNGGQHSEYGRIVRIKLDENPRMFTPIARGTYKWEREYRKRTSVERVNSRIDESFGFEKHFIWGIKKMKLRMGMAMVVMLAMAVGHAKRNRMGLIRSLVRAA